MDYELAKELKEAGFPQECENGDPFYHHEYLYFEGEYQDDSSAYSYDHHPNLADWYCKCPTLSELIEACGDEFRCLKNNIDEWIAYGDEAMEKQIVIQRCKTPEEAVAKLWLKLNSK